jgi:prepilin-type N-terminal cleavage/methylation domain-containing protein
MTYRNQAGFTLTEMLVVLGIVGALSVILTLAMVAVTKTGVTAMEQNRILSQVEEAGRWISRDIQNSIGTVDNTTGLCKITNVSRWDGTKFVTTDTITYNVANGVLMRTRAADNVTMETIDVAQFIDPPGVGGTSILTENESTRVYSLTVKSVYGDSSITRVYKIQQVLH